MWESRSAFFEVLTPKTTNIDRVLQVRKTRKKHHFCHFGVPFQGLILYIWEFCVVRA